MSQPKPKILVLFYSMYGHIFAMAKTVAEGVLEAGGEPIVKQVAELIPTEFWDDGIRKAKETMKEIPVADPRKDLNGINGLIVGTPTRFGNMTAQMRNFWDQTGGDWMSGTIIGKPAAVFTSTATQHGGQETTIITSHITLLHQGMVIVGLPYSETRQSMLEEISGGSPYGASTITAPEGSRMPSENELAMVRFQGRHVATIAKKLAGA